MRTLRVTALLTALVLLSACGREPSASQLTATGVANLQSAKTAHLDGTGSIALKAQSGLSLSLEFKLAGDASTAYIASIAAKRWLNDDWAIGMTAFTQGGTRTANYRANGASITVEKLW